MEHKSMIINNQTILIKSKKILLVLLLFFSFDAHSQLITSANNSASDLAQIIAGPGVIVSNASLTCAGIAEGEFNGTNCNIGINSGVILTCGTRTNAEGPNNNGGISANNSYAGDVDLTALSASTTHDACVLEFDVFSPADTLQFNYSFGSDEYLEYVGSYNDAFGFFISGPGINGPYSNNSINIALIPGTNTPVTINNVNNINNSSYYVVNGTGSNAPYNSSNYYIQYDGFTKVLTAVVAVQPCATYHLKLAIADAADFVWDSGVFIEAGSLTSNAATVNGFTNAGIKDMVEGCVDGIFLFERSVPDTAAVTINFAIGGTASNGVDYNFIPSSITIPANQTQAWLNINVINDNIPEGAESLVISIQDPCYGNIIDSATLWIQDTLIATISPDTTICPGSSVNLSASGGASFLWTPSTGLSNPFSPIPVATPPATTTYTLIVSANACSATDSVTITVNPPVIADPGPDTTICSGDSIQLNAYQPNITSYWWAPQAGVNDWTIPNPIIKPNFTTTYFLTAHDNIGCTAFGTINITVNPSPFANAGTSATICYGDSTQLQASGPGTYLWSPPTGLSDTGIANPWASPPVTTQYTLTVTAANGCPGEDSVNIVVTPLPNTNAGPDVSICEGGSTQLMASGGVTYSWQPATGLSASNIANPVASPMLTTSYTLTATNIYGCSKTDSVIVSVYHKYFANAGNDTSICIGSSAQLHASGGITYMWTPNNYLSNNSIANPVSFTISSITYYVAMTDAAGCIDDDSIHITVNPLPQVNVTPIDTTICYGEQVPLMASGGTIYQWNPAIGLSNPNMANPIASPGNTITYSVLVTDAKGCSRSDTARVNVNPLPFAQAGKDTAVCIGSSTQLNGSGGLSYQWTPATGLSNPNMANPIASPIVSTLYTLTVINGNNCSNTDSVYVLVQPLPIADAGQDQSGCSGMSFNLHATGGVNYQWSPSTGLSNSNISDPLATPPTSIQYSVLVSDANGCVQSDTVNITIHSLPVISASGNVSICPGNSTQLNSTGAINYIWTPASGLSNPNIANPIATPSTTTSYTVTGTDTNGCQGSDQLTVQVYPAPQADAGADQAICIGASTQLNASGGVNYQWSPATGLSSSTVANPIVNINSTQTYTVQLMDANGCLGSDSTTVSVHPLPVIQLVQEDTSICKGDHVQLGASGGIQYQWTPSAGLSNPGIANPLATPLSAVHYVVSVTDGNGCEDTSGLTINFYAAVDPNVQPVSISICPGESVQLNASGGVSYQWTPPNGLDNPVISNPVATPSTSTVYTLTIIDIHGCSYQGQSDITIYPAAFADAGSDQSIVQGQIIELNGMQGSTYLWTPATGLSDPTIPNPKVLAETSTWYVLHVWSADGCEAIDSVFIEVLPLTTVYIPNAFSPNADGQNDEYRIEPHDGFELQLLQIFNRWGVMVFETTTPGIGWDGTYQGQKQAIGTYVYLLKGFDSLGNPIIRKGNISLLR